MSKAVSGKESGENFWTKVGRRAGLIGTAGWFGCFGYGVFHHEFWYLFGSGFATFVIGGLIWTVIGLSLAYWVSSRKD